VAFARRPPNDPRLTPVAGDIRDADAVTRGMQGADVVVHFAWALEPLPTEEENRAVNVGGTQNVLEAMRRTGCQRLVFSSSVMAYGSHADNPPFLKEDDPLRPDPRIYYAAQKAEVESIIAESGVSATITRPAIALGHNTVSYAGKLFGMPMLAAVRGVDTRWQLVHPEDVARFHAEACFSERTGTVNLAAPGVLSSRQFAEELHRNVVTLPRSAMDRALRFSWEHHLLNIEPATLDGLIWPPVVDTTRLTEDWGFVCGWAGREAAEDAGRVFAKSVYIGARKIDAPWRIPWSATQSSVDAPAAQPNSCSDPLPDGQRGEFDSIIDRRDRRYRRYRAASANGKPAGPLRPLTLDLALTSARGAGALISGLLHLPEPDRTDLSARPVVSIGHRLYVDVSTLRGTSRRTSPRGAVRLLLAACVVRRESNALRVAAARVRDELHNLATMTDERLLSRLSLARDLAIQACAIWSVTAVAIPIIAADSGTAKLDDLTTTCGQLSLAFDNGKPIGPPTNQRARTARGIRGRLAARIARHGEAAGTVWADILNIVTLLVAERGRRIVSEGRLDTVADTFALTFEELCFGDRPDLAKVVSRRWSERDRFSTLTLLPTFDSGVTVAEGKGSPR
jgi:nucleoside-diphosphate-sugar epimerase